MGVESFIDLDLYTAIDVVFLGFIGGVLSGFIGTGGAFIMTPGMMNLGVSGVMAVGTNITHKFGKAIMGARRHAEMGNVDKKLGLYLLATALIGVKVAVWINRGFAGKGEGAARGIMGDLYISTLFVVVLTIICVPMIIHASRRGDRRKRSVPAITVFFSRLRIPPLIHFPTADVTLSFWLIAVVGLMTGFLAGSIGVGGFLGVPAMIYLFGVPTAVAAGTELFLAGFMGAWGAANYAWSGLVDLRLVVLLYLGSLTGIYVGAYGTRVVKEKIIRMITALIILLCVISRACSIPMYLHRLEYISLSHRLETFLPVASKVILFLSGTVGVAIILGYVVRAYRRGQSIRHIFGRTQGKPSAS